MVHAEHFSGQTAHILVGDSTPMQCELLARVLKAERDFQIVAIASDSAQILRYLSDLKPSIAVVSADLQDGPGTGLKVLAEAHTKRLGTRCILLLDLSDRRWVIAAFRNGARGVFFRAQPLDLLPKCIRIVHQGQIWANTRELNYVLEALAGAGALHLFDANGKSMLTQREAEVVRLVAEGLTNREIAGKLQLSDHTVKNYIFRIFDKTGVSSRVGLVLYAFSQQKIAQGQKT
jgi:DNA-binding NarL/FixJ family response regulator